MQDFSVPPSPTRWNNNPNGAPSLNTDEHIHLHVQTDYNVVHFWISLFQLFVLLI
jgi:hypothetical protein